MSDEQLTPEQRELGALKRENAVQAERIRRYEYLLDDHAELHGLVRRHFERKVATERDELRTQVEQLQSVNAAKSRVMAEQEQVINKLGVELRETLAAEGRLSDEIKAARKEIAQFQSSNIDIGNRAKALSSANAAQAETIASLKATISKQHQALEAASNEITRLQCEGLALTTEARFPRKSPPENVIVVAWSEYIRQWTAILNEGPAQYDGTGDRPESALLNLLDSIVKNPRPWRPKV